MRAAGVNQIDGAVALLELAEPRALRADEILLDIRACGVGNWDEFVRTGGWETGIRPPMALGVEAAGVVAAVGSAVTGFRPGDLVSAHSVPLREQGSWAEWFIVPAEHCAMLPSGVPLDVGAALPVPALTADRVIRDALTIGAGQTVLVHGAGGVTGGMLVQLAAHRGATVIVTASPQTAERLSAMGAARVLDYRQPDWPGQVRLMTNGGVDAAANAVRSGAGDAVKAVRDGGSLATITADPPAARARHHGARGAGRAGRSAACRTGPAGRSGRAEHLLDQVRIRSSRQAAALALARHGAHGAAVVLRTGRDDGGPR